MKQNDTQWIHWVCAILSVATCGLFAPVWMMFIMIDICSNKEITK